MKLKMVAYPRPGQTDMVVGGKEVKLGDSVDLSKDEAEELQARWPGCFEGPKSKAKDAPEDKEGEAEAKQAKKYENKAATAE
jgi:hypothetical protein